MNMVLFHTTCAIIYDAVYSKLLQQRARGQSRRHGSQVIEADGSPTISGRGPGSQMGAGPGRGDGIRLARAATAGGFR